MNKKIGIVLSGGGAKGAFEIGVLKVLLEKIKTEGDTLHSIAGSSIGALNGAFVASGQFEDLKNIWLSWTKENCPLIQTDFFGPIVTMLYRGYQYHPEPVKEFIENNLSISSLQNSQIKYINNATRLGDCELRLGGNIFGNTDKDLTIKEIMASMAFVPGTPSVTIDGQEYGDGGFIDAMPIKSLIDNNEKLDRIYVVSVSPAKVKWNNDLTKNDISGLLAKINFVYGGALWPEANRSDIEIGALKFGNPEEYYVINPEFAKMEASDFDSLLIKEAYEHGIEVAKKIK
jgi:NTE family protein